MKKNLTIMIFTLFFILPFVSCNKSKSTNKSELTVSWYKTQVFMPSDTLNYSPSVHYVLKIMNPTNLDYCIFLKKGKQYPYLFNIIKNDTLKLWPVFEQDSITVPKNDSLLISIRRDIFFLKRPNKTIDESILKEIELTNNSTIFYLVKDSLNHSRSNTIFKNFISKDSLYEFEIKYNYKTQKYKD